MPIQTRLSFWVLLTTSTITCIIAEGWDKGRDESLRKRYPYPSEECILIDTHEITKILELLSFDAHDRIQCLMNLRHTCVSFLIIPRFDTAQRSTFQLLS